MKESYQYISLALILMGLVSMPVQAVRVSTEFTGTVTHNNRGVDKNPFGLAIGDSIYGSVIYDDALIAGTTENEMYDFNALQGIFKVSIGKFNFTYNPLNGDRSFYDNGGSFSFNKGVLDGLFVYLPVPGSLFSEGVPDFMSFENTFYVEELFIFEDTHFPVDSPEAEFNDVETGIREYIVAEWDFASASKPEPFVAAPTTATTIAAIPEPTTIMLLLAGLAALGLRYKAKAQ